MEVGYGKSKSTDPLISNANYQNQFGSLLYNSQPDITASVSILAQRVPSPSQEDWDQLKRVVKYLWSTVNMRLKLNDTRNGDQSLYGFADANWAEDKMTFFLNGGVIDWAENKENKNAYHCHQQRRNLSR